MNFSIGTGRPGGRRAALALGAVAAVALSATAQTQAASPRAHAASYLGTPVSTRDAPWMVAITAWGPDHKPDRQLGKRGYGVICSGAVIAPQRVLTAGHCVDDNDLKQISVSTGVDDATVDDGDAVPVKRAWILDKVHGLQFGHDLAVIETTKPLGVPALPIASARPAVGEAVVSFGYGAARQKDFEAERALRLRRLDSIVLADCARAGDASAICTEAPNGGGGRPGDSGGPLIVLRGGQPQIAGVLTGNDRETGTLNVISDATSQAAFVAAPPDSALFPILREREIKIAGRLEPGARVSCVGTLAPAPRAIHYQWTIGSDLGEKTYDRDASGKRHTIYLARRPFARSRSITIPRSASGKPISCAIDANTGPYYRVTFRSDRGTVAKAGAR